MISPSVTPQPSIIARRLSAALLAFLFSMLGIPECLAQRDAPVFESRLSRFAAWHDKDQSSLVVDFSFRKVGGPHEHTEYQCYILAYAKSEEEAILKLAVDPTLTDKKTEKNTLLEVLLEKKLVVALETKVAPRNTAEGTDPGTGKHSPLLTPDAARKLDAYGFSYSFTFNEAALFEYACKLKGFDESRNTKVENGPTWWDDRIKLMVFIPANDSKHADKVSPEIRKHPDAVHNRTTGLQLDYQDSLLCFRPLPYEILFQGHGDKGTWAQLN